MTAILVGSRVSSDRKAKLLRFDAIRPVPKPIFGTLHLTDETASERLAIAKREIITLVENGVDRLVVESGLDLAIAAGSRAIPRERSSDA